MQKWVTHLTTNRLHKTFSQLGVHIPLIELPASEVDLQKWAVVACDQYTSQRDYWEEAEALVGDAPSTLRLMLPEIYLEGQDEQERIASIKSTMGDYLCTGILRQMPRGSILVHRTIDGETRNGLVLALDLDCYDFSKGSQSLIRATEGTILERIPPRMRIREGAPLEMPHILVLIDDIERTVIEPLAAMDFETVYDVELMKNGGHLTGRFVPESALDGVLNALHALFCASDGKYKQGDRLLYAVGDGNHSLATAKTCWEAIKKNLTAEEAAAHPARYALCEIENVHDAGITFEPIHRLLFGAGDNCLDAIEAILKAQNGDTLRIGMDEIESFRNRGAHVLPYIVKNGEGALCVLKPLQQLEVGTLQLALDVYLAESSARIDYVHGNEIVQKMGSLAGNIGFFLPTMKKEELFKTVVLDGALPRKTFSMGEAWQKRYYMELRRIV